LSNVSYIPTGGLQTDSIDLAGAQQLGKVQEAGRVVRYLPVLFAAIDGDVQFSLGDVDSGCDCGRLGHLRHPFLVMRTLGSFNHPGLMKSRSRSCSPTAQQSQEERSIRRPAPHSGRLPGVGRSSWNDRRLPNLANTRRRVSAVSGRCFASPGEPWATFHSEADPYPAMRPSTLSISAFDN